MLFAPEKQRGATSVNDGSPELAEVSPDGLPRQN